MDDQVTTKAKAMIERAFDPNLPDQLSKRGRALAEAIGDAAETASGRAATTWRDAEPIRRDAARAGRDALRWSRRTWRQEMQPGISRLWSRRAVALGAAGAAVPVARELIDDAAVRLGIRTRREQRHWGTFFAGLLIGAAAGMIAALLTAPKAGREMRDELAGTARDAAMRARDVAGTGVREVTERAREAAAVAGEWVPIFQRAGTAEADGESAVEAPEIPEVTRPASRKRPASPPPSDEAE
jgi:hypothetical protein